MEGTDKKLIEFCEKRGIQYTKMDIIQICEFAEWFSSSVPSAREPLKPLEDITQEDRNELAEIVGSLNDDHLANALIDGKKYFMDWKVALEVFQLLQDRGFALPVYFPVTKQEEKKETAKLGLATTAELIYELSARCDTGLGYFY